MSAFVWHFKTFILMACAFGQLLIAGYWSEEMGPHLTLLFIIGFILTLQTVWPRVIRDNPEWQ